MRAILAFIITIASTLSLWTHGMLLKVLSSVSDLLHSNKNRQSQKTIYKMGKKDFSDYTVDQGLMSRIDKETLKHQSKRP